MSAPRVLVVDDEPDIRELLKEILEDEGYRVTVAGDAARARQARVEEHPDLALLDIWMPDIDGITLLHEWQSGEVPGFPVIMISGHGTIETAVEATRLGAFDFVEKPLSLSKLLVTVRTALASAEQRPAESPRAGGAPARPELIGTSQPITALRERIARLRWVGGPVLVHGEPGAGKRTVARLLHHQGTRREGPCVELDLGTVAEGGAAEALFGEGGAWASATGGTLILHDLAELDARAQAQLLAHLEHPGAETPRLAALSAEDLPALVAEGPLRAGLYHALNAAAIRVPPLREHAGDVPDLLAHFVDRIIAGEGLEYRRFTVSAQNRLRHYDWPGNVTELASLVRRLLLTGDRAEVDADAVDAVLAELRGHATAPATAVPLPLDVPLREARERFERVYLQHQLRAVGGRIGELARRVGMERTHLYRKLKSLGIDYSGRKRG